MENSQNSPQLSWSPLTGEIIAFANFWLGVNLFQHRGQITWIDNSTKLINILVPGNQWGKTLVTAIKHTFHLYTKYELRKFNISDDQIDKWITAQYTTLNFGKTYEIAKSVHEAVIQLINGEYELVDPKTNEIYFNESKLKGTIIKHSDSDLPYIKVSNNAMMLTRSTDDMGSSFKRRRLAYVTGDECGDIQNIRNLVNITLLPRVAFFRGSIDLVGTPQDPNEYEELVTEGKENMELYGEDSEMYVQGGQMYDNPGLSNDMVAKIERIADEDLRRRIIKGEFVETGERYFQLLQIEQAINEQLHWSKDNSVIESPLQKGWYIESCDFAAEGDKTVIAVFRYDRNIRKVRLVYFKYFKGKEVPLPMQYQMVREVREMYSVGERIHLTFDGQSLGGKHAYAQLKDIKGLVPFPEKGITPANAKARALGNLKGLFDKGRRMLQLDGRLIDVTTNWGGIEFPVIKELKKELEGYKLDDTKIRNDMVVTFAQAADFIERRKPKVGVTRVRNYNFLNATIETNHDYAGH